MVFGEHKSYQSDVDDTVIIMRQNAPKHSFGILKPNTTSWKMHGRKMTRMHDMHPPLLFRY